MEASRTWSSIVATASLLQSLASPASAQIGPLGQAVPQPTPTSPVQISRVEYAERLRGMWLAECIANWTGLETEGDHVDPPFLTDSDWNSVGYVFQDPWGADDDTDIEYVYLHLIHQHGNAQLTAQQIAAGWIAHINSYIWVSDAQARALMDGGVLPPATGMGVANPEYLMIDAQLTTEFFGALAPGMPISALRMGNLPIRTTSADYATHAAQFFAIQYALVPLVDPSLSGRDQVLWLVREARRYMPSTSKTADVVDFVLNDFLANPDVDNWELTRNRIYERYHWNAGAHGFVYRGWFESSVNFATGVMALLYGEGNLPRTIQIGTLSGWDSDNGTATMGGLLGLLIRHDGVIAQFGQSFSDRYWIWRTRGTMPDYLPNDSGAEDTFTMMAERMLPFVEQTILAGGGRISGDTWSLPALPADPLGENPVDRLYRSSANNRVRLEGGTVTATANGVNGSAQNRFADGREHDFGGEEDYTNPQYYTASGSSPTLEVTYSVDVELKTLRFIEGAGSGFGSITPEIRQNDAWVALPRGYTVSQTPSSAPYQVIDFTLESPVQVRGVRVRGPASNGSSVTIAELDALSSVNAGP